ncbi:hypothetical protein HYT25_03360 [Candidatus Pacearchaeota archaeon]|nr:hypothetical protein [Candidatus Pacearchaeota archaeon]
MDLEKAIMKRFLRKLVNLNIWGGRHTEVRNLQKSLPDHLRGTKEHKNAIKELINLGFLNVKPSTGEMHVSLNSHKQKKFLNFCRKKKNEFPENPLGKRKNETKKEDNRRGFWIF